MKIDFLLCNLYFPLNPKECYWNRGTTDYLGNYEVSYQVYVKLRELSEPPTQLYHDFDISIDIYLFQGRTTL